MPLRIGITLGDPAGIGPEIVRSALESGKLASDIDYNVIGQVGAVVAGTPSRDFVRVGRLLDNFLRRRGKTAPRIAVAGLNPHAGESGKIGREEIEIIAPALRELQSAIGHQQSAIFEGPISPDTLFFHLANEKWD